MRCPDSKMKNTKIEAIICEDCKKKVARGQNYWAGKWEYLFEDCDRLNPTQAWRPLSNENKGTINEMS